MQAEPAVEDARRVQEQRLLALGATRHLARGGLLGAHGAAVEAQVAEEAAEVAVVLAVEVDALDLGRRALQVKGVREDHLNAVEEADETVDDVVGLQRLQLADREEVVVVVRVHEMGTIPVIARHVANLPNTMLGEDARNWAFFANSTGSVASASEVAVIPMSM